MSKIDHRFRLSNGYEIPVIGLGTWKSKKGTVAKDAVLSAIGCGYRHIDCARNYNNEDLIGEAIKMILEENEVKREELFITSKLWNTFHRPNDVIKGCKKSLDALQLDYLDLYLMHWPLAFKSGDEHYPRDPVDSSLLYDDTHFTTTWREMETLIETGLVRSIGVSNFNCRQLEEILNIASVKPMVLQIESHPYLSQEKLLAFCKEHDILVTSYSPLGSPGRAKKGPDERNLFEDSTVLKIARDRQMTPAQVLLRFQIERGVTAIPKSVMPSRIKENFEALNCSLTQEDMEELLKLNCDSRRIIAAETKNHKYYPWRDEVH